MFVWMDVYVQRGRGISALPSGADTFFFQIVLYDQDLPIPALPLLTRRRYREGRTLS